jgi:hypothetical protein
MLPTAPPPAKSKHHSALFTIKNFVTGATKATACLKFGLHDVNLCCSVGLLALDHVIQFCLLKIINSKRLSPCWKQSQALVKFSKLGQAFSGRQQIFF